MEVSLFGLAFVSHYINVVAGLELGLAFMVQHFRKQQHAFGLGANVHDDVGRRELKHRALEHVVLARRLCCLGGKAVEHGSKVVGAGWSRLVAAGGIVRLRMSLFMIPLVFILVLRGLLRMIGLCLVGWLLLG